MENLAPASSETAPVQAPQTPAPQTPAPQAPPAAPQNLGTQAPVQKSGLDFIPEQFKTASWATKYQNPEDFFKGVDHMTKVMGQKQIVQGVQTPGAEAPDEEWDQFYSKIGRPESSDKYTLPEDIEVHEGFDIAEEKKTFTEIAHKSGITQKQAEKLFKNYVEKVNENYKQDSDKQTASFDQVVKQTFPDDPTAGLAMAKRGAKALGIGDKLDQEGLSLNPTVLQLCAKLGELAGEDSFVRSNDSDSKESLLDRAKRLQSTPAYWNDQKVFDEVAQIYKQATRKK